MKSKRVRTIHSYSYFTTIYPVTKVFFIDVAVKDIAKDICWYFRKDRKQIERIDKMILFIEMALSSKFFLTIDKFIVIDR